MPFYIEIDYNQKIIKCTYSGVVKRTDLSGVWQQLIVLKEFNSLKYNLLSDFRNSKFDIPREESKSISQFLKSIKNMLENKKEAIILNNPEDTALSLLLHIRTYKEIGYMAKLFSTEAAALNWLNNSERV